jgi:Family of unknown function (DUF6152)
VNFEEQGTSVKKLLSASLLAAGPSGASVAACDRALAHHSFSMFEYGSSTELEGTVQEFRYVNPHAFISHQTASGQ